MKSKKINTISIFLIVLLIPIIICLLNSQLIAFNLAFYNNEFEQYEPEVNNPLGVTKDLITYLKYPSAGTGYLVSFNEEEIAHLRDVKGVMQTALLVLYMSIVILVALIAVIYYLNKEDIPKIYKNFGLTLARGGALTVILGVVFKVLMMNFKSAFAKFHHIFFSQGGWQFPPSYNLVKLFPENFFIDVVNSIVLRIFITAIVVLIAGISIVVIQKRGIKNG